MRRRVAVFLAAALLALACGPGGGKDVGGKDDKMTLRGCKGGGGKVNPPADQELWIVAVVCVVKMDDVGAVKPLTKRVNVIITAFDQRGVPGLWVDTPQNGPPVPRPYPKDTNEITPYRHPIYFQPGLIITVSTTATLKGREGEFIECWYEDMHGAEIRGTYNMTAIDRVDVAVVHCNTTAGQ